MVRKVISHSSTADQPMALSDMLELGHLGQKICLSKGHMSCLCHTVTSISWGLEVACWERNDLLTFLDTMFSCAFCHFPIWCPGSGIVLVCIDS